MNKLVIVGVDSVVGANLALALADRWEVVGLGSSSLGTLGGVPLRTPAATGWPDALALVGDEHPDWIVHCPRSLRPSWDSVVSVATEAEELRLADSLARLADLLGARLTTISTDAVFAGPRMFHDEQSSEFATTSLAKHARELESRVLEHPGTLVLRTCAYGWSPAGVAPDWAERTWQGLSGGTALAADGARYATPILATDLAELIQRAWQLGLAGLLHVTGAERTNGFRFACELAQALGVAPPARATRPGAQAAVAESSLGTRRACRALETPMPLLREGLCRFAQQLHSGWRQRLLGRDTSRPLAEAA